MTDSARALMLALLAALPAAARQKSATFHVGAAVVTSARVSAEVATRAGTLQLRMASNASPPAVQVGDGPLQHGDAADLRLPESGTVVVTVHY